MKIWITLFLFLSGQVMAKEAPLKVYCYDALSGRDSFGAYLTESFFSKTGIQVQFVSFGTAGEAANQIFLEGKNTQADILMGVDSVLYQRFKAKDLFEVLGSDIKKDIEPSLLNEVDDPFIPFDYGFLAFLYDSSRTQLAPILDLKTLPDALKPKEKVVLQDPRTSSLGIEFLVWTYEALENKAPLFWKRLAPFILTISPGWSGAYELFLRKQADLVLSFTTSPAYHRMRENRNEIKSIIFKEGHFQQIEGLLLLKTSRQKEKAKKFISYVIGKEAQERIPELQWMYPARKGTQIPKEFREIPVPKRIKIDWGRVAQNKDQWVKDWAFIMSKEKK